MKFQGTSKYISTDDLTLAVNASITLERPLLVKGEPGTGKTELARQIAESLSLPIIEWNIKSTTKAQQGLYEYDAVSRLRDSQLGDERVKNIKNYIKKGVVFFGIVKETTGPKNVTFSGEEEPTKVNMIKVDCDGEIFSFPQCCVNLGVKSQKDSNNILTKDKCEFI